MAQLGHRLTKADMIARIMNKPWTEIFDQVQLSDIKGGDEVILNIVSFRISHVALIPCIVERTTPEFVWARGVKFWRETGAPVRKHKHYDQSPSMLFEMTPERRQYLIATKRIDDGN